MISAALPTNTPKIEMLDMMWMALTDFFENRYLPAIKKDKFNLVRLKKI